MGFRVQVEELSFNERGATLTAVTGGNEKGGPRLDKHTDVLVGEVHD